MATPSFDEIAQLIAEVTGVDRRRITPSARLEKDLGVTGDDGVQLLQALANKFDTDFDRPDHGGRYLFGPEGCVPLGLRSARVIPITVGDLHLAAVRGRWEDPPWPAV